MKVAKIKNEADYDRTFFGVGVTIEPKEMTIDQDEFTVLNKNCRNFQDMTNPPEHGGEPRIRVLGSTPSGDVRINGKNLNKPTLFTAPEVRLKGDDITEVPEQKYNKLQNDNRFNNLIEDGELRFMGMEEK
ncbi:MAG: hypothetical protein K9L56_13535 [Clostridiales bacterium]|nr:hypothetical protein [Clostridiales bacterium]